MKDLRRLKYFLGIEVAHTLGRVYSFLIENIYLISSKKLTSWAVKPLEHP